VGLLAPVLVRLIGPLHASSFLVYTLRTAPRLPPARSYQRPIHAPCGCWQPVRTKDTAVYKSAPGPSIDPSAENPLCSGLPMGLRCRRTQAPVDTVDIVPGPSATGPVSAACLWNFLSCGRPWRTASGGPVGSVFRAGRAFSCPSTQPGPCRCLRPRAPRVEGLRCSSDTLPSRPRQVHRPIAGQHPHFDLPQLLRWPQNEPPQALREGLATCRCNATFPIFNRKPAVCGVSVPLFSTFSTPVHSHVDNYGSFPAKQLSYVRGNRHAGTSPTTKELHFADFVTHRRCGKTGSSPLQ